MTKPHPIATLCIALSVILNPPARGAEEMILFEKGRSVSDWTFTTPVEGAVHSIRNGMVEFTLEKWFEGRDGWPRLRFSGDALDLSDFTELVVEIENTGRESQTLVFTAGISNEELSAMVAQFEPRQKLEIHLNIAEGCGFDPSRTLNLQFYRQSPPVSNSYRLSRIRAVKNPDFVSLRAAMAQRLEVAATALQDLVEGGGDDLEELHGMLENAGAQWETRTPGYGAAMAGLLDRLEGLIARTHMDRLGVESLVWTSPLSQAIRPDMLPEGRTRPLESISETLLRNQYAVFCINISAARELRGIRMRIAGNDGVPPGLLALRDTEFVKARDGGLTADAVHAPAAEVVVGDLPAHETRQVLLWVDTRSKEIAPGDYAGEVELAWEGAKQTIPVRIEILEAMLPERLNLLTFTWAVFFHTRSVTPGLQKEALADLRDYGINSWNIEDQNVALPELDAQGNYAGLQREDRFRQVLELLQGHPHENFILWLGLERGEEVQKLFRDPQVIESYLAEIGAIMDEYGVPKERRYFTLMDEPKIEETLENIKVMARFKTVDPEVRFFDNGSDWLHDEKARAEFFRLVDVWCPNWDHFLSEHLDQVADWQERYSTDIGFYRCLMGRNNRSVNIYEYYRLAAWRCMRYGFGNLGFWSYNAGHGEDTWDGTTGSASGGVVVYVREGKLYSSRRWEVFREGLTDYAIVQLLASSDGPVDVRQDESLLTLTNQILAAKDSPAAAESARRDLVEMLSGEHGETIRQVGVEDEYASAPEEQ